MNFASMSIQEMLVLNQELCAAIRARRTAEASNKVMGFQVGDRVRYEGGAGVAPFFGTITKVLRVNCDVVTDHGRPWRINASMLTKVAKANTVKPVAISAEVIEATFVDNHNLLPEVI